MPIEHYWPVRDENKCSSIKYAVDWGNSHKKLVRCIYLLIIVICICSHFSVLNIKIRE
jgi:hypothetical protein